MISKQRVCDLVDRAASDIEWCWGVLAELKNKKQSTNGREIAELQGKLTGAIWLLDDLYRDIHAERRRLISKKEKLNLSWFKRRMASLDDYQKAIRHAISIAKVVGDGFAWIFYVRERELIEAHLKLPRQLHLPPKIGRTGERAFIEKLQVLEGRLVLYHGITSFLRMGDVSFYDFSQQRITNIGELKTKHVGGNEYRVNLGFVYGGKFSPVVSLSEAKRLEGRSPKMELRHAQKLDRQLKQIAKAISPDDSRIKQAKSLKGTFYFDELDRLLEASSSRAFNWKKVGRGLLIGTLRLRNESLLSKRLVANGKFHIGKKFDGANEAAKSILDPALAGNSLLISNLGVGESGVPGLMKGTIPAFWWPIKTERLHDLIFSNVIAITLYNPAPFWHLLRSKGFELSIGERAQLKAAKIPIGKRVATLHNFEYFQSLITQYLMSEDDVVSMIESALDFPAPDGAPMRVEISPQLRF